MWIAAALLLFFQSVGPAGDGLKALEEHRYEAAVESFHKAIEADPADYSAHFNLAVAYGFLNQDAAGIAEYRKTLELKPGSSKPKPMLGCCCSARKIPPRHCRCSRTLRARSLRISLRATTSPSANWQTGDVVKAEENFRAALAINAKSAGAELGLAHSLIGQEKLGRRGAALSPGGANRRELSRWSAGTGRPIRKEQSSPRSFGDLA